MLLLLFGQVLLCRQREREREREGRVRERERETGGVVCVCVERGGGECVREYCCPSSLCTGLCLAFPSHPSILTASRPIPQH
jgi:hypothetical protein